MYLSQFWRLKVQDHGVSRAGFSPWLADGHFLPVSSHGLCVSVLIPSFYKDTSHMGVEPTSLTSFNLNHLFKDCLQMQLHSEALGVRTPAYELWRGETQLSL